MNLMISIIIVFIISFLLIFKLVYSDNKEQPKEEKLNFLGVIFVTCLLAIIPTVVIALFLLVLLGSTSTVNMLFSLHLSTNQLIILAIFLLIYLFSIDSIIEIIVKHIVGKNIFYFVILLLIRMLASYALCLLIGLKEKNSFIIATGVAVIIFLLETLYFLYERGKEEDLHKS